MIAQQNYRKQVEKTRQIRLEGLSPICSLIDDSADKDFLCFEFEALDYHRNIYIVYMYEGYYMDSTPEIYIYNELDNALKEVRQIAKENKWVSFVITKGKHLNKGGVLKLNQEMEYAF